MSDIEKRHMKRVKRWGLTDDCQLLQNGGKLTDIDYSAHLAQPPRRGLYIIIPKSQPFQTNKQAIKDSEVKIYGTCTGGPHPVYGGGIWGDASCKHADECYVRLASINTEYGWVPAVRPDKQDR